MRCCSQIETESNIELVETLKTNDSGASYMGLNMLLSCKKSGLIETVVSITVKICVFTLRTSSTINGELFILFISNKFQTD